VEINRLNLDPRNIAIIKHMQMQIDIKNVGSTIARDLHISVDLLDDGSGIIKNIFKSTLKIELFSNSSINVNMDLWLPIASILINPTRFHLNLDFVSIHGESISRIISIESIILVPYTTGKWNYPKSAK